MNNATTKKNNKPVEADDVLGQFDRLRSVLVETHATIPSLLERARQLSRDLGLAEVTGENVEPVRAKLASVQSERESAVRRRVAAINAIVGLEAALRAEREMAEAERQEYAQEAVQAFQARYEAAVAALQQLWSEGEALGRALRTRVEMPLPVIVRTSPVDGEARAEPVRAGGPVPAMDGEAERLGAKIDAFDNALALVASIRSARQLDAREHELAVARGHLLEQAGLYIVRMPFTSMDGEMFQVGRLLDSTLVGPGTLRRLQTGRKFVEPVPAAA